MGISNKSHSKKSDKETQSPVLKLFRDMMQKEKHDPEKTNLLNCKQEKKKKKHSGSRSKSNKSIASSCSERQDAPYKGDQSLLNAEFDPIRTQSTPFQGEKRESWWFWGDNSVKPVSDETCSCVSCALKKLISTDYACMACLILLFTVSVLIAFLLVYKSIPCMTEKFGSQKIGTDRPKRKIEGLSRIRWDQLGEEGRQNWNSRKSSFGLPQSMDVPDFQDLSSLVDSNSELVKMLDNDLMSEIQSSDKLREFYKKLIKTDAQIQNLKKNNDIDVNNIENFDKYRLYPERAKRSLRIFHRPLKFIHFKRNKNIKDNKHKQNDKANKDINKNKESIKVIAETKDSNQKNIKTSRNKRFDNNSEPEGFVIENKKVLIRYKPSRKSKCSHTPKDSKSHEKQLKHPFYQNTQRLDELLDKFIDKNLEILDPFGFDMIVQKNKKCKHPKLDEVPSPDKNAMKNDKAITNDKEKFKTDFEIFKNDKEITKLLKTESNTANNIFAELEFGDGVKRETTTDAYGLLMSVSTLMYPDNNDNLKRTTYLPLIDRVPNARKLLQTDSDDDVNEVIIDARDEPVDANDDNDDQGDRKERMDESNKEVANDKLQKNPATIVNPNWKGPMPLYPDELNSMVKQETRNNRVEYPVHSKYNSEQNDEPVGNSQEKYSNVNQNINRVESPLTKDTLSETDEFAADLNDVDYIEDYFRNKYDRLVEMAQAYSDYGVLEGKKSIDKKVDEKIKTEGPDRRIKQALSGLKNGLKKSIFGRSKKGSHNISGNQNSPWEGFRFEFQPTSETRDDNPIDLYKALQKHVKLTNRKPNEYDNNITPINAQAIDLMYSPKVIESKTTKKYKNGIMFAIGKGKRTLKSVNMDEIVSEESKASAIEDPSIKNNNTTVDEKEVARDVVENIHLRHKREVDKDNMTIVRVRSNFDYGLQTENRASNLVDVDKPISSGFNDTENVLDNDTRLKHEASNNSLTELFQSSNDELTKTNNDNESTLNLPKDKSSYRNDSMSLSDFFMMLSKWFSALDGVDSMNQSSNENISAQNKSIEVMNNSEINYPIYDADMIENIGHRSRVLLSVEEVNTTTKELDKKQTGDDSTDKTTNITNDISNITHNENKIKAIVKRNADDSNLVFWNDLYDDEYGVIDNTERNIREKYSVKNDFIKKSDDWFRDKVRKISDGIYKKAESFKKDHIDGKKGKDKIAEDNMKSKQKEAISNRFLRDVDGSGVQKTNFAALTANMKKICRQAAKDVAMANKVDVRDVSKEGQVTSSLMQHLVRLMGDLVDYQVKQRTCRKLPADLQNFLEWLTSPGADADAEKYNSGYTSKTDYSEIDFDKMNDNPEEDHTDMTPSDREERPSSRSDCLGTLQSVRVLMKQYEELSDDDKSKMTGVKKYLEDQTEYLQRHISSTNELNFYNTDSIRYRRDVSKTQKDQKPKKKKRKLKQIFSNLMKKLERKHHNSNNKTAKINNKIKNDVEEDTSGVKNNIKEIDKDNESKTVKEKRNLRDVFYKAVEDAKKLTTVKSNKEFI